MEGLLQATFDGVEIAFAVASDWVRIGSYRAKTGNPSYDPDSDTLSDPGVVINNVRFIQVAATLEEREAAPISINDVKFIVPSVDLPNIIPSENDTINLDGVDYNLLIDRYVPGRPIHIFFARQA